jgi:hypothetical protein
MTIGLGDGRTAPLRGLPEDGADEGANIYQPAGIVKVSVAAA